MTPKTAWSRRRGREGRGKKGEGRTGTGTGNDASELIQPCRTIQVGQSLSWPLCDLGPCRAPPPCPAPVPFPCTGLHWCTGLCRDCCGKGPQESTTAVESIHHPFPAGPEREIDLSTRAVQGLCSPGDQGSFLLPKRCSSHASPFACLTGASATLELGLGHYVDP